MCLVSVSADESILGKATELSEKKLLDVIESSYPNPVTVRELSSYVNGVYMFDLVDAFSKTCFEWVSGHLDFLIEFDKNLR